MVAGLALGAVSLTATVLLALTSMSPVWGETLSTAAACETCADSALSDAGTATATPGSDTATSVALASASASARPTVAVRRGGITERLLLSGRVSALEESSITFPVVGRVEAVLVKPGDTVVEGQTLIQAETTELLRELNAARSRVELGTLRLEQAQAQAVARQRQAEHAADVDQTRRQSAVVDAESAVRRAQEDLARVKVGAPMADRRAAEAAVVSAQSSLEGAESELARASAGPGGVELKTADQAVWSARLALQRAQADFDRLARGADPAEVRAADREVAAAQTTLDRARMEIERLTRGDPVALSSAERELQRAELGLRTAQSTRVDSRASRDAQRAAETAREASIANARLAVRDAQERLAVARRGPDPTEVSLARRNYQSAQSSLQTANERLEQVRRGPDDLALSTANQAVESARTAVQAAEARYLEIAAGPPPERIAATRSAVLSARAGVAGAVDRLNDINSRPTRAELRDAEERVATAQVILERVQAEPAPPVVEADPGTFDRVVLEKNLDQDRSQVATLEQQMEGMTLRAPFAGVVSAVQARPGDPVDRGMQVVALAKPGDPVVNADVNGDDAARMTLGQRASIQGEGMSDAQTEATVVGILDGPGGAGRVAQLKVSWKDAAPAYGAAVQAVIIVQEKDNVLLIPQRAIRSSGQRRYVEYLEGDARRTVDVSLGIFGAADVEVLSGLREGQVILAGTGTPTPGPTAPLSPSASPAALPR
jgi:HlyD family secretion protein